MWPQETIKLELVIKILNSFRQSKDINVQLTHHLLGTECSLRGSEQMRMLRMFSQEFLDPFAKTGAL